MEGAPMETSTWRKASHSANQGQCVEVHGTLRMLRDSKNAEGARIAGDVSRLVAFVKRRS